MKKYFLFLFLAGVFIPAFSHNVPESMNYINDYGELLSEQEENQLNQILKAYHDSTSNQLVVLTLAKFDDVKDGPLFDFSMKVFDKWKIGQKSKNNGVLLVVVKNLTTKNAPGIRIVTGYGLEGALPDAICSQVVSIIRPLINEGKYYKGIEIALQKMISRIKDEYRTKDADEIDGWTILMIIIIIIVLIALLSQVRFNGILIFDFSSSSDDDSEFGGFDGGSSGGGGAGD